MRKMLGTLTTMALFVGLIAPAFAADEEITLRGELIDTSCYTKQGFEKGTGAAHVTCAKDCAKKGQPLGILTDGDGVFKITGEYTENNNAKLLDYVGKKVEVKGAKDRYLDYSTAIKVTKITVVK